MASARIMHMESGPMVSIFMTTAMTKGRSSDLRHIMFARNVANASTSITSVFFRLGVGKAKMVMVTAVLTKKVVISSSIATTTTRTGLRRMTPALNVECASTTSEMPWLKPP